MDTELSVEDLYKQAAKGDVSESVLKFLYDYFEKRKEQAERKICNCESELGKLLEARAELKEVRRMEQELLHNIFIGKSAGEEISKIQGGK